MTTPFPLNRKMRKLLERLDKERSGLTLFGSETSCANILVYHDLVTYYARKTDFKGFVNIAHLTGKGRYWVEENRHLFTGNKKDKK